MSASGGNFSYLVKFPTVEQGLDYILGHFYTDIDIGVSSSDLWPRTISTKTTQGRQIIVYSREEALARFKQANLLDCRISAYPSRKYYKRHLAPNFLFIDLDSQSLELNKELRQTLSNMKRLLENDSVEPTVLWSGKGYHIYLPTDALVLEDATNIFEDIEIYDPSRRFMQWSEQYLTDGKADPCHSKGVSFNNCMLRVPGSINSKNCNQVRIIQRWNGVRPSIKPLLYDFYIYLADIKLKEAQGVREERSVTDRAAARKMYGYWRRGH